MNYPQEMYDEVRIKARYYNMLNETIDCILSTFATVPKVTPEEAVQIRSEYYRRVGPEGIKTAQEIMQQVVNSLLAKQRPVILEDHVCGELIIYSPHHRILLERVETFFV